jgi:RimJ/RimL family protein N-acetyltransferase
VPVAPRLLPEELRTERLLLRQFRPDDAEALHEIYVQPEYLEHMPPLDLDGARAQIERFAEMWDEAGHSQWATVDLVTGRLIGRTGILRHNDWTLEPHSVPEVGWVLHRDFWGRGLATEAGRASLECWRELMLDEPRLYSFTTPENVRSRAVMERLGLTLRGQTVWRSFDIVWYAIDR